MEERIELGGRSMRLCYTLNSLCEMETAAGASTEAILSGEKLFSGMRALIWGGLIERQPELTLREVGDMLDAYIRGGGRVEDIAKACSRALAASALVDA